MHAMAFIRRQQDTGCKNVLNKHPEMAPRDVQLIIGGVSIESVIIQGNVSQALSEELWVQRGATHIFCHRITDFQRGMLCLCTIYNCNDH